MLIKTREPHADFSWLPLPEELILAPNGIHLYRIPVSRFLPQLSHFRDILSSDELEKAERFRFPDDRHRFIITHALLRYILSRYLEIAPKQVQFSYGAYGKPALAGAGEDTEIRFNLSHAGNQAVVVVTRTRQVGVDIEHVRPLADMEQIAERLFSENEKWTLRQSKKEAASEIFFRYWTRKEAFVKARGDGLSFPLQRVDVSQVSEKKTLGFVEDDGNISTWSFFELFPATDYVAALVVEGENMQVSCWECPDTGLSELPFA